MEFNLRQRCMSYERVTFCLDGGVEIILHFSTAVMNFCMLICDETLLDFDKMDSQYSPLES